MTSLQDRAREARRLAGHKTVPPWAKRLGLSTAAIYLIEGGKTLDLKAETASRMAKYSGLSADWIRTGKGDKHGAAAHPAPLAQSPNERIRMLEDELYAVKGLMYAFFETFSATMPGAGEAFARVLAQLPAEESLQARQVVAGAVLVLQAGLQSAAQVAPRASPRGLPAKPPKRDK